MIVRVTDGIERRLAVSVVESHMLYERLTLTDDLSRSCRSCGQLCLGCVTVENVAYERRPKSSCLDSTANGAAWMITKLVDAVAGGICAAVNGTHLIYDNMLGRMAPA